MHAWQHRINHDSVYSMKRDCVRGSERTAHVSSCAATHDTIMFHPVLLRTTPIHSGCVAAHAITLYSVQLRTTPSRFILCYHPFNADVIACVAAHCSRFLLCCYAGHNHVSSCAAAHNPDSLWLCCCARNHALLCAVANNTITFHPVLPSIQC